MEYPLICKSSGPLTLVVCVVAGPADEDPPTPPTLCLTFKVGTGAGGGNVERGGRVRSLWLLSTRVEPVALAYAALLRGALSMFSVPATQLRLRLHAQCGSICARARRRRKGVGGGAGEVAGCPRAAIKTYKTIGFWTSRSRGTLMEETASLPVAPTLTTLCYELHTTLADVLYEVTGFPATTAVH